MTTSSKQWVLNNRFTSGFSVSLSPCFACMTCWRTRDPDAGKSANLKYAWDVYMGPFNGVIYLKPGSMTSFLKVSTQHKNQSHPPLAVWRRFECQWPLTEHAKTYGNMKHYDQGSNLQKAPNLLPSWLKSNAGC